MITFDYRRLEGRIVEKYGNKSNFAKTLDVTPQAISQCIKSGKGFSAEKIEKWRVLLDILPEEIGDFFYTQNVQETERGTTNVTNIR